MSAPCKGSSYFWMRYDPDEENYNVGFGTSTPPSVTIVSESHDELINLVYAICAALDVPDEERNKIVTKIGTDISKAGSFTIYRTPTGWTGLHDGKRGFTACGNLSDINVAIDIIEKYRGPNLSNSLEDKKS
jgi:hypothetical protein